MVGTLISGSLPVFIAEQTLFVLPVFIPEPTERSAGEGTNSTLLFTPGKGKH